MKAFYFSLLLVILCVPGCFSSYSQPGERIIEILTYCDSVDELKDVQTVRKTGAGVLLEYMISGGSVLRITERPIGYKYISARVDYYIRNNEPVCADADIEISGEEGSWLTLELHKIYLGDDKILRHYKSERTYDADSLYRNSDPVKTALDIRKKAAFRSVSTDPEFERSLINSVDKYLDAFGKKEDDPVFDTLFSPFI